MSDVCGSCRAPIEWTITPKGARSPVDKMARPAGNVLLLRPHGLGEVLAVVLSSDALNLARQRRLPLHLNHWATCPDKEEWRQRQRERRERAA